MGGAGLQFAFNDFMARGVVLATMQVKMKT